MKLLTFNGDYLSLSEVVRESWSENKESTLNYTPEFLRSCFEYPGATTSLAPMICEDGKPVAFIAGFPRSVEWNGNPQRLLLSTLLTSSPRTKGKGFGAWLWIDLAQ